MSNYQSPQLLRAQPIQRARLLVDELSRRLADEARERQRLQDMYEDAGLVFMMTDRNTYSEE